MQNVLLTCPPMIGLVERFRDAFSEAGLKVTIPEFTQVVPEAKLIEIVPNFDGWIIGDDPATRAVFEAGAKGNLKAAVKWGVGTDNVDFVACKHLGIPITNTPGVFGREVADIAMGYVIALARQTHTIDRSVRAGIWHKPSGISLWNKTAGVIGFGDIGRNTVKRLLAHDLTVTVFDPFIHPNELPEGVIHGTWPKVEKLDFLVFTAPLTTQTKHMFDLEVLAATKPGVRLVNVGRGAVVQEEAILAGLASDQIHSIALDVFETEPLPVDSPLLNFSERCLFGSHNGSNTEDAVTHVSLTAIGLLCDFLRRVN